MAFGILTRHFYILNFLFSVSFTQSLVLKELFLLISRILSHRPMKGYYFLAIGLYWTMYFHIKVEGANYSEAAVKMCRIQLFCIGPIMKQELFS
jgi:hypothetical protein